MSTGKRLAKRSIIGTRVCAPSKDGKYYSGVIHAVKTPVTALTDSGLSITPQTRYSVRFDSVSGGKTPNPNTEYSERDLIGPGFGSVTSAHLVSGQKVYLTYNGREINAEVTYHREHLDEVEVVFAPNGQENPMTLTKRIDEVRLLESRKSARLADQDTDFARLADMAGDRKRASSHSIDVPHVPGSRKRRPSSSNDSERSFNGGWIENSINNTNGNGINNIKLSFGCGREGCRSNEHGDCMDECTAALVLMSLSCSPHSPNHPLPLHCQHNYGSWDGRADRSNNNGNIVVGSPGTSGTSNSSSSSSGASWRSGTPSPPLSEEGVLPACVTNWPIPSSSGVNVPSLTNSTYISAFSSTNSTPGSTGALDEGIVLDYLEDMHPKKKKTAKTMVFQCTWPGCFEIRTTCTLIEQHVREGHLGLKKFKQDQKDGEDCDMSDHEEEFYYQEVSIDHMSSPPTMSHRDMARPPHEDPEYQKMLRLETIPVSKNTDNSPIVTSPTTPTTLPNNTINNNNSKERLFNFGRASSTSPGASTKHMKLSTRQLCQQNVGLQAITPGGKIPSSPRKVRGETKKCRKIYGMDHRELWCTQCKWKKACSRFGE
ncbi:hypothetical protein HCN44_008407 [Aphidius gifuensis]|uniref:DUF4772 domain-containing protein n=1 Tax=Aphidius gifuensis TaxID=684658 RepID=A0A835CQ20_APHGI|nr:zinc finger protein 395-like [Aphidius gifuensis]KAF7989733.1 hypothetical protein HCN44_008407 [Aphidius gifuensis]